MNVAEIRDLLESAREQLVALRESGGEIAEMTAAANQVLELRKQLEEALEAERLVNEALSMDKDPVAEHSAEPVERTDMAIADADPAPDAGSASDPEPVPDASPAPVERVASLTAKPRLRVQAGADLLDWSAGTHIPWEHLGEAFASKADAMRRGGRGRATVARIRWSDPEIVEPDSSIHNGNLVASAVDRKVEEMRSLVASGGFCAPAESLYDIPNIASVARPLRAALPTVTATRGRIRFTTAANLADTAAGIDIITAAEDAAGASKPVVSVNCPTERTAEVEAVTLRVRIGNFDRMTFPEHWDNFFTTALAQHARVAERHLLDLIDANCTPVSDGKNFGAARDLLHTLTRQAAIARDNYRMGSDAPVVVVMRDWVREMIRADLSLEAPGAASERLAVADAEMDRWFAVRNLVPVWTHEGRTGGGQDFAQQGAGVTLGWPSTVEVHMFHPGAFVLLEMPELDLGTEIRDSTLNATNDVEAFLEIFEGIAYRGLWARRISQSVCVSGEAAALTAALCTGS